MPTTYWHYSFFKGKPVNLKGHQGYVPSVFVFNKQKPQSKSARVRRFLQRMTKIQAEQVSETSEQAKGSQEETERSQEQGAERSQEEEIPVRQEEEVERSMEETEISQEEEVERSMEQGAERSQGGRSREKYGRSREKSGRSRERSRGKSGRKSREKYGRSREKYGGKHGWKDTRNFIMRSFLRVCVPINSMWVLSKILTGPDLRQGLKY